MQVKFKGKISRIDEPISPKEGFTKIDFVVDVTENNFTKQFPIQAINDKVDYVQSFKVGDEADITCYLVSQPWTSPKGETKIFLNLNLSFIKKISDEAPREKVEPQKPLDPNEIFNVSGDDDDSLPFK